MKKIFVTMIVSNLNGIRLKLLQDCLNSLIRTDYKNWELIVVDNNSDDQSVSFLKEFLRKKKNCKFIQNPVNMYSQGLNLGAHIAKGEYLAYFNNDVAIEKGYFDQLVRQFKKDKKLGIAQGKLLNFFDRKKIDSAGETMDIYGNPITIGANETDNGQYDKEEEILSASGSACVIRKSLFNKIGGYDPDYGIGYEDMDFALRARKLGFKVKRFPKAICYHKRASTDLSEFIRIKVKWHFNKNRICTMIKNYPFLLLLRTLPLTLLLYIGITFYEWFFKKNWQNGKVRITSIIWVIANLGTLINKRKKINKISKNKSFNYSNLFSQRSLVKSFIDFISISK